MSQQRKILIIDDDEDYRASTRALLEDEGFLVLEAASGGEGLTAARQQRPDLIILDVMMQSPGEGCSVNQALKTIPDYLDPGPIPVLMVSSLEMSDAGLFGMRPELDRILPPDAYMTKPLNVPEFLACVRQLLKPRN